MFDIGLGEIIVLAALALLVFGPDHLPKAAAQAGRFVRDLRTMAASARKELSDSADLDGISADLKSLADLHPKRILTSVWEDPSQGAAPAPTQPPAGPKPPAGGTPSNSQTSGSKSSEGATPTVAPQPQGAASEAASPIPPVSTRGPSSYDPDAT